MKKKRKAPPRRKPAPSPFALGMRMMQLGIEAQMVAATRIAGMMMPGFLPSGEERRMVSEKADAFARAAIAASAAAVTGKSAEVIAGAGLKPVERAVRRNRRRLLPAVVLAAFAGLAPVEPHAQDASDVDCSDPSTQPEMTYCAGVEYEEADAELNAIWPNVVAEAKRRDADSADYIANAGIPTTLEALRAAQRAWIVFRDRQCELESYAFLGGTGQPMAGSLCLAELTRSRIGQLRDNFLNDNR